MEGVADLTTAAARAILRALSEGQVRSDDRRAVFVGAKAYEEAGGSIIRDLFDAEGGGFFADAELLNRLAREKLQGHADKVAEEGWRWVVAEPELDHEASAAHAPRLCQARAALEDRAQASPQAASAVRRALLRTSA